MFNNGFGSLQSICQGTSCGLLQEIPERSPFTFSPASNYLPTSGVRFHVHAGMLSDVLPRIVELNSKITPSTD